MKENPDEIKSKTHNETYIDLLILGIEKKEREREKSQVIILQISLEFVVLVRKDYSISISTVLDLKQNMKKG